jgi:hypothetical protein
VRGLVPCSCQSLPLARTGGQALGPRLRGDDGRAEVRYANFCNEVLVAVYTIKRSQYDLSPAFLLMVAGAISFVVVVGLRETNKLALSSATAVADAA